VTTSCIFRMPVPGRAGFSSTTHPANYLFVESASFARYCRCLLYTSLSAHVPAILISSKARIYDHESQADVFLARGMYAPADLLERIRLLLVRKRGPKRMQQRAAPLPQRQGVA